MLSTSPLPGTTWLRPRSRVVAAALWLVFGTVGIHRAYLNRQYRLGMFLAGFTGWGMFLVGADGGLSLVLGFGLLLLFPVGCLWLLDLFRLFGWVADHNVVIDRRPVEVPSSTRTV